MKTKLLKSLKDFHSFVIAMIVSMVVLASLSFQATAQTAVSSVPSLSSASSVPATTAKSTANTARIRKTFNHLTTGFALTGVHQTITCESCHVGGNFKGTPRSCQACHTTGVQITALAKPPTHIQTTKDCDTCHNNTSSFQSYVMDHTSLTQPCSTCHSGSISSGSTIKSMPSNHPQFNPGDTCDNCHKNTFSFITTTFHTVDNVTSGCASCHDTGVNIIGTVTKNPAGHVPYNAGTPCEACHTNTNPSGFTIGAKFDHTGISSGCSSCHNGQYTLVMSKPSSHMTTSAACEVCHTTTTVPGGFSTWTMDHAAAGITSGCASCHTGATLNDSKATVLVGQTTKGPHITTTAPCETCHTSTITPGGFATWTMNHTGITTGCATCHTGATLGTGNQTVVVGQTTKGAHITTAAACETCHTSTVTPGGFATWTMNHTGITSGCASCHTGGTLGSANPTVIVGQTTHPTHITTAAACETCHTSTVTPGGFSTWTMNHTGITSGCSSCHDNSKAVAFYNVPQLVTDTIPPHIPFPTNVDCGTCHTSTSTGAFTSTWTMGVAGHNAVSAQTPLCANCHGAAGAIYTGVKLIDAGHMVYPPSDDCGLCHTATNTASYTSFSNAGLTDPNFSHAGITTGCASCHSGQYAGVVSIPTVSTAHISIGSTPCENCHTTTTIPGGFSTWTMNHAGFGSNCSSCHTGATLTDSKATVVVGKTTHPTHITTSLPCESCHSTSSTSTGGFAAPNWTMNHSGITTGCSSCHDTTKANAFYNVPTLVTDPSPPHIPVPSGAACESCHAQTFTTGAFASGWSTGTTLHSQLTGTCASCHDTGKTYTGVVTKPTTHITYTAQDCGTTCHTSSNTSGYTSFLGAVGAHTSNPLTGSAGAVRCDNCHGGGTPGGLGAGNGGLGTQGKAVAVNHIPTNGAAITTGSGPDCVACHTYTSFISWTNAQVHTAVSGTACNTCHASTKSYVGVLVENTSIHIPISTDCAPCHSATQNSVGNFATSALPFTANHNLVSPLCATCHTANATVSPYQGALLAQNSLGTHMATNGADCGTCHTPSNTSTYANWQGAVGSHSTNPLGGSVTRCDSCHLTSSPGTFNGTAGAKEISTGHIPVPGGEDCVSCHSYTTFTTGNTLMSHAGVSLTSCATCHGGTYASVGVVGKNTSHVTVNNGLDCSSCHSTTVFTVGSGFSAPNWTMNHTANGNTSSCATCHVSTASFGTTPIVSQATHPTHITTTADCGSCHTSTSAGGFPTWVMGATQHTANGNGTSGCASCHDSSKATAFYNVTLVTDPSPPHIPVAGVACESCHTATFTVGAFTTSGLPFANNHSLVTATLCSTCHVPNVATSSFTGVMAQNGGAIGVHPTESITTCDSCHTASNTSGYTTFAGATGAHTSNPLTATNATCASCHGGGTAGTVGVGGGKNMPANHSPIGSVDCGSCHAYTSFDTWTAAGVHSAIGSTITCASCHTGATAGTTIVTTVVGKPTGTGAASHISTTLDCVNCHSSQTSPGGFTTWAMGATQHTANSNTSACTNCHNTGKSFQNTSGTPLVTLNTTIHVPIGSAACESCHSNSTFTVGAFATAWTMGTTGHTAALAVQPLCATCHGTGATGYTGLKTIDSAHIPAADYPTEDCGVCHTATTTNSYAVGGFTSMTGIGLPTHTNITSNCAPCHNNVIAKGTASFASHVAIGSSDCVTCHTPTNTSTYTTFLGATAGHDTSTAGTAAALHNCAQSTCHSSTGSGKVFTSQHIPSSSPGAVLGSAAVGQCDYCHTAGYTTMTFLTETMSHATTAIPTQVCSTCHSGTYTGEGTAGGAETTTFTTKHIPTIIIGAASPSTSTCSTCHSGTTNWTTMTSSSAIHNGDLGGGSTAGLACYTCHASSGTYLEPSGFQAKNHNGAGASKDCSASNCHAPGSGGRGTAYSNWGG